MHPLIRSALASASAYRILHTQHGHYNLWRFKGWDHKEPGWKLIDQLNTRSDCEDQILERLGLEGAKAAPARAIVYATITALPDYDPWDWL